jgi:hypothetical protein
MRRTIMPDNVKTARLCLVLAGCLEFATAGLVVFILVIGTVFVGWGGERSRLLGSALFGGFGLLLVVLTVAVGVLAILTARAVARGLPWGRPAGLALGLLVVPLFPVGTVLGFFILKGMIAPGAGEWFNPGRARTVPRSFTPPPRSPAP